MAMLGVLRSILPLKVSERFKYQKDIVGITKVRKGILPYRI